MANQNDMSAVTSKNMREAGHEGCASGQCRVCNARNVPKGFHCMPDGSKMRDSEMNGKGYK